jgi:invasion protein IalB
MSAGVHSFPVAIRRETNKADMRRSYENSCTPLRTRALGAVIALGFGLGDAAAQQAVPPSRTARPSPPPALTQPVPQTTAAPSVQTPQRTTATYEAWVLRCDIQPGPPPQKACEIAQLAQVAGQPNPISRVAIGRPVNAEAVRLQIQLPVNVSFVVGVKVQTDDKDPGLLVPFRRCVPAGCFAEADLHEDSLKRFRASIEPGKMTFKDAGEHDTVIPLSFKGFDQAYEALLKQ